MRKILALDIGGTHLRAALVTKEGKILKKKVEEIRSPKTGDSIVGQIKGISRTLSPALDFEAIGIGMAGLVDKGGTVLASPNLNLKNFPLGTKLEKLFSLPVKVENDANLAALGEVRFGAGKGCKNLIYITVSTGIGGGIIENGRLIKGQGLGGEIGHMVIEPEGPLCSCGKRGHLEALASGTAIAREGERVFGRKLTSEEVFRLAEEGDREAGKIFEKAGYYLGLGIVNLLHIFNPEIIIMGGGVAQAGEFIFEPVKETIKKEAFQEFQKNLKIVPPKLGDNPSLLGALVLFQ